MSVESVLLDFQVTPTLDNLIYVRDVATVAGGVADALRQDCLEQGSISSPFSYASIYRLINHNQVEFYLTITFPFSGPKDCMFTIKHYFREGLITLSLEYFKVLSNLF